MSKEMMETEFGKVPKVLLFGNGINRAYGFDSWDGLIESIQTKDMTVQEKNSLEHVPYPLRPVILTDDHIGTQMKCISRQLSELQAAPEEEKLLCKFVSLPIDAVLTANYTYELEKALDGQFKCLPARRCKERKVVYTESGKYNTEQLHTCFKVGEYPPIWHIHGEAARHGSIVLGHYYYGKLLAKQQQYMSSLIARYHVRTAKHKDMEYRSWLDYFMLGDVYIVGLGMELSELDLWWLVNCKKRNFPDRNVVLYKPDIKPEERMLANAYGVIVESGGFLGDYKAYYQWTCGKLAIELNK